MKLNRLSLAMLVVSSYVSIETDPVIIYKLNQ